MQNDAQMINLVDAVFAERDPLCFRRTYLSFVGPDRTKVFVRCANDMLEEDGVTRDVTVALMIYPALKWMLNAEAVTTVAAASSWESDKVHPTAEFRRLFAAQQVLVGALGKKPEIHLEERKRYYVRCRKLLDVIESALHEVAGNVTTLKAGYRIEISEALLSGVMDTKDGPQAGRAIKRYFAGLVNDVAEHSGDEISSLVWKLTPESNVPRSAELAYLYHNIDVLLREYSRILYSEHYTDEKFVSKITSAMDAAGRRADRAEAKCEQACFVMEYVKLIKGAIELVRDFPGDCGEMYSVLCAYIDGKRCNKTDEEIADSLFMSAAKFSVLKYRALSLLGAILWGGDALTLVNILQ